MYRRIPSDGRSTPSDQRYLTLINGSQFPLGDRIQLTLIDWRLSIQFRQKLELGRLIMQSKVFRDFDEFAESVVDIDSRMMLRNPQRRLWRTTAVKLGEIDVQLGQLGSGNIAQGELRSDGYMFYLPLSDAVEYTANGSTIETGSLAILEPGCEFCITTKVQHDWCVAFVPTHMIAAADQLAGSPSGSCRVTRRNYHVANRFQTLASQILAAAANCCDFESSPAAERAAKEIERIVSVVVGQEDTQGQAPKPRPEGRPKFVRQEIIRLSLERLAQRADEHFDVGELAAAANVSERTLRTAYGEYFGVGPVRYLQLRQLHQIRRALRAADQDQVTVSSILMEHEVWAFSRFAARYQQLFGELPSDTLRSKVAS